MRKSSYRVVWLCAAAFAGLTSACSRALLPGIPSAFLPPTTSSVGEWSGTTSQGMPISFTVSPAELLTTMSVGYDFNGCVGSHTFSDLLVRTAPDLTCIPGPCTGVAASYRAFGYVNGTPGAGPVTQINGVFLPGDEAKGQVVFRDYAGCGTAPVVEWVAIRK
jgi:hypothetical protein